MRFIFISVSILLAGSLVPAAGFADGAGNKAEACLGCHTAGLSLKGRGVDTIAAQIKAIRAGEKNHPPGLADLSDADIAEMADYLDGA